MDNEAVFFEIECKIFDGLYYKKDLGGGFCIGDLVEVSSLGQSVSL